MTLEEQIEALIVLAKSEAMAAQNEKDSCLFPLWATTAIPAVIARMRGAERERDEAIIARKVTYHRCGELQEELTRAEALIDVDRCGELQEKLTRTEALIDVVKRERDELKAGVAQARKIITDLCDCMLLL